MDDPELQSDMLDCQHQLIARVVLAGWQFDSAVDRRRINDGYRDGKWQKGEWVTTTTWRMVRMPLDRRRDESTEWVNDKYEAACEAFKLMQDREPQDTSLPEGSFELREDNTEPENERRTRQWRRSHGA